MAAGEALRPYMQPQANQTVNATEYYVNVLVSCPLSLLFQ